MERIEAQDADSQKLAKHVLSWIISAKRHIIAVELQHAFAVEVGKPELNEKNLPEIEDMVSVCAGLVNIDKQSYIIRLVHYTAQEYFERTKTSWFPNAQRDITETCVTYLSFTAFETYFYPMYLNVEAQLRYYPLYDYAAQNWGYHAYSASIQMETKLGRQILEFLQNEAMLSSCGQAIFSGNYGYYSPIPTQMTGLHLAAYFGLVEATAALLKNEYDVDSKDSYGRTPISWAAEEGYEPVVRLLLKKGAELESIASNGLTPLSYAAERGHEAVAKLLLEKGAELESVDIDGLTPLSYAAKRGHEAVVKLLLEKGAELEPKDTYDQMRLRRAAALVKDAKLLLCDVYLRTPFSWGAWIGLKAEPKYTYKVRTPLSWAAERGHEAVVKLLLEKGAELESKDNDGHTPLSWAADKGHEAVVKLLGHDSPS
jgi:hypothetical protein